MTRQSIALRDQFNQAPVNPTVSYDPVRRVARLANPSGGKPWLVPGQSYKVIVSAPTSPDDLSLRAIDGAGLATTVVIGFFAVPARGRAPDPEMAFCRDVFPILKSCGQIGKLSCHHGPDAGDPVTARAELILDYEPGVEATAKNKVSWSTNTGSQSAVAPPGPVFGVDMPIIDPGNPGNSFLLYKLLINEGPRVSSIEPAAACTGVASAPPTLAVPPSADETARLADVVPGAPMPHRATALPLDDLDRLRVWIEQGAPVVSCNACAPK